MKIISVSDLHGYLPQLPECDVVTISGDIIPLNIQKKLEESIAWLSGPFQTWALNLPCQKVLFIAGNHDFALEYLLNNGTHLAIETGHSWRTMGSDSWDITELLFQIESNNKIVFLSDSEYNFNGVKFYGTPWCPSLMNWAFYKNSDDLNKVFAKIPKNTDVLITHCPPKFGTQGVVLEKNWNYRSNFGCEELYNNVKNIFSEKTTPTWVISGHIHSGNHKVETENNINYVNVSIKDEDYKDAYKPFEFIIEK